MADQDTSLQAQLAITLAVSRDLFESGARHGASKELLCFSVACWTHAVAREIAAIAPADARIGIARALREAADAWDRTPRAEVRH